MFTIKVSPSLLFNRINAEANAPELVENARALQRCGMTLEPLGGQVTAPINNSIRDIEGELDTPGAIIPMFRPADIDGFFVNPDSAPKLDAAFEAVHEKARVHPGDIVLAVAGTVAAAGRVPSWVAYGNVNGSCARIKPKPVVDGYLLAYLNSVYGFRSLMRLAVGSVQKHLNLEDLPEVAVPQPAASILSFIGDKVRQAERLRSRVKTLQSEAKAYFTLPGMDAVRIGEFRSYRATSAVVDSIRLDPKFYDPGHFKLQELLRPHQPVPIRQLAMPVSLRWAREEPEFFYLEIGDLDLGSGLVKPTRLSTVDAPSRATTLVQPGDVLVSTVRPNRKNVGLVPKVGEPLPIVASSGFSVLRFRSPEEAAFWVFWLRSDAATMQLMRWDAGSSYPAIDESVPLKVLVPRYADEVVREKGARWYQSFRAQALAEQLTTAAKLLVEALIEGKVTEAELVTAQETLELGDDTADRAVLRRLTRHGLDVPGQPPLFPDLDALYALVAQTREEVQ